MPMNDSNNQSPGGLGKKPYEKPGFRYEEVFVTSALTCAKAPNEFLCKLVNPKKFS